MSGSRPGSRNNNGTHRSKFASDTDDPIVEGVDMQAKLVVAFDTLQTPAMSRLSFMRKYAQ